MLILMFSIAINGCSRQPGNVSPGEVIKRLKDNRQQFDDLVRQFQADNPQGSIAFSCNDRNFISWNGISLKPVGSAWELSYAGISIKRSFEKTARILGSTVESLNYWIDISRRLPIEEIRATEDMSPAGQSPIEISFCGRRSARGVLTGVIFVPKSNESTYKRWTEAETGGHATYTKFELISDRWFYFEVLLVNRGAITLNLNQSFDESVFQQLAL